MSNYKHGHRPRIGKTSDTYKTWRSMMVRVNHKPEYAGITVCNRWHSFTNFLLDMGERPPNMSIDRIDPSKGYEPNNCRWATPTVQSRNKRKLCGISDRRGKHLVRIGVTDGNICIGTYASLWDAICARKSAENQYWSQ